VITAVVVGCFESQSFPFSIAESIYVHFDPFINQKEALVLPLFSY